jgi:hypothetical protein
VKWTHTFLRVRTATGEAAPAPDPADAAKPESPAKPDAGAKAGPKAPAGKPAPRLRGLDLPAGLRKPILVYFHWPHGDGERGKQILKFCTGTMDEPEFVKVTPLYHCVQINTLESEARLLEEVDVRGTPTILLCGSEGTVLWRSNDPRLEAKALAAAMRKTLEESFPEAWKAVQAEIGRQKETLARAKAHVKEKEFDRAEAILRAMGNSDVRFSPEWSESRTLLADVMARARQARRE